MKKDEELIRKLWNDASRHLCNGDWEKYSVCWDHSSRVQVIHPDQGEWLSGWESVKVKYQTLLGSGMRCTVSQNKLSLNLSLSGDMAWGTANTVLEFSDESGTSLHLWEAVVFEKINGQWKMVMGMASIPEIPE